MPPIIMALCSVADCANPATKAGFCEPHYRRNLRYGSPTGGQQTFRGSALEFVQKAASFDQDDCLIWPFSRNQDGYGKIRLGGKTFIVSRLVCEMVHGQAADTRMVAAHSCGKGHLGCVNPKHIRWATHAENMADMSAFGNHTRGSRNVQAKLTDDDVREIRASYGTSASQAELAHRFSVSGATISRAANGLSWSDLDRGGV